MVLTVSTGLSYSHRMTDKTRADYEIEREFPSEYSDPLFEVADVFRKYGNDFRKQYPLLPGSPWKKAMDSIQSCRTTALGGHVYECDACQHQAFSYNSCRNRNCPKCRASQRAVWVEARELEVLPIQYFHIVFTLPHALLPLCRANTQTLYNLLFRCAADTLQDFAFRRWEASLGITMVLHTWGQTMNEHPHVHCVVTGGALKKDGRTFVKAPQNFLFPVKALSPVFQQKFLEALSKLRRKGSLFFTKPELTDLHKDSYWKLLMQALNVFTWVVYAKQPFDKPSHLYRYLGRYINRIAIANHRIKSIEGNKVSFSYLDNKSNTEKIMVLPAHEFIRRFLSHVLPKGFRRIRYFGFLVNSLRKASLTLCRQLLGLSDPDKPFIPDIEAFLANQAIDHTLCPVCGEGTMKEFFRLLPYHDPPAGLLTA